jgi:hypothetical protein
LELVFVSPNSSADQASTRKPHREVSVLKYNNKNTWRNEANVFPEILLDRLLQKQCVVVFSQRCLKINRRRVVQSIRFHVCEYVSHFSFCSAHYLSGRLMAIIRRPAASAILF